MSLSTPSTREEFEKSLNWDTFVSVTTASDMSRYKGSSTSDISAVHHYLLGVIGCTLVPKFGVLDSHQRGVYWASALLKLAYQFKHEKGMWDPKHGISGLVKVPATCENVPWARFCLPTGRYDARMQPGAQLETKFKGAVRKK